MNSPGTMTVPLTRERLAAACERGRQQARRLGHAILVSVTSAYGREPRSLDLFSWAGGERTLWLRPDRDFKLLGLGQAAELTSDGLCPMTAVKKQHAALMDGAVIEGLQTAGTDPVFTGGFRYDPRTAPDPAWEGFPDARFTLPRLLFTRSNGATRLTVNAVISHDTDGAALADTLLGELHRIETGPVHHPGQPPIAATSEDSRNEWRQRVNAALGAIEAGSLGKVVLARHRDLRAAGAFSAEAALDYLTTIYPSCAVFAVGHEGATFLGASPEGLASVTAGRLNVSCLASSAPRGGTPDEDREYQHYLLASPKERREHAAVAGMLAEALGGVCAELNWRNEPQILKLNNIQHLYTPFTGSLKPGVTILDVVERLHPTPAVGGVPTGPALDLIRELEGDRGWYAAPVGWFDGSGSGDFVVGIRSALLRGATARLYAGCGIVAGSEPEREFRETELKFQPLLAALGAER